MGVFPAYLNLTLMVLFNLSEGSILRQESIFWVLYASTWVLTTRWLELATSPAASHLPAHFNEPEMRHGYVLV